MKNEREEIDRLIKQALTKEEEEYFHQLDEQNFIQQLGGMFQGKMKWLIVLMTVCQLILFGFAVYFGYKFFNSNEMIDVVSNAFYVLFLFLAMGWIKFYQWMEMNKNSLLREVKRLELQVSLLAKKREEE